MHPTYDELERAFARLVPPPRDVGVVRLLVARPEPGARQVLDEARLDPAVGLVGDSWLPRGSRHSPDGSSVVEQQLTLMSAPVAELVAVRPERVALAGDQVYVDLDLSVDNLPAGTLLTLGTATVQVSALPHLGCKKFVSRFGADAMRFVNSSAGRRLRLRGLNARVVTAGVVRPGDTITVLRAGSARASTRSSDHATASTTAAATPSNQ